MTVVSQYILFETHQIKGILIHFVFYFLNFVGNTENIFMIPKFYEIAAPILRNLKNPYYKITSNGMDTINGYAYKEVGKM